MQVIITGGTGTIGQRLAAHLLAHQYQVTVLSRRPVKPLTLPRQARFLHWDGRTSNGWLDAVETADIIINLAGAGVADRRWTRERKTLLLESRVQAGQAVVEAVSKAVNKPKTLIQASAVGYYGGRLDDKMLTEESDAGEDFLAEICIAWEEVTDPVLEMGLRRVIIRTGVVLDMAGGALPKMVLPFKFFAGGPVGSGKQWFPWIHWLDEVDAIRFLIENEHAAGPVNLSAPNPLKNRDFSGSIGKILGRPAVVPAPGVALKLMFGEMSDALLKGQRVIPAQLHALGYEFKFPEAESALHDLLFEDDAPTRVARVEKTHA
jgi:uncharacterized protein (TIGR01777 family)